METFITQQIKGDMTFLHCIYKEAGHMYFPLVPLIAL